MALKGRRRKIVLAAGVAFGGLLLIVLSLPLWLPWVLRPVAPRFGITYATYTRLSYTRFALADVKYTDASVRFQANKVEGMIPTVWLWKHYLGRTEPAGGAPYLRADNWKLEVIKRTNMPPTQVSSVYTSVSKTTSALTVVKNWLPTAIL